MDKQNIIMFKKGQERIHGQIDETASVNMKSSKHRGGDLEGIQHQHIIRETAHRNQKTPAWKEGNSDSGMRGYQ